MQHADAEHRVLEPAERYAEHQMRWHNPQIRACGRTETAVRPVGEAVQRAAQDLGTERHGQSFKEFAGLVITAAEARGRAAAARPGGDGTAWRPPRHGGSSRRCGGVQEDGV
jgi:hypothetical protein